MKYFKNFIIERQQGVFFALLLLVVVCFGIGISHLVSSQALVTQKLYGVNRSGGEFGADKLPGVLDTDYTYPTNSEGFKPYAAAGMTLVRVPFLWERVQAEKNGVLIATEVDKLAAVLDAAAANKLQVILDLHNYGRYYNTPLAESDATMFADVWSKLALRFGNHPALYGFELMNEPHDMPGEGKAWNKLAQAAADAIRSHTAKPWILVPGYSWQAARFWQDTNKDLRVADSANKVIYTAHIYFDKDNSGLYSEKVEDAKPDPAMVAPMVKPFTDWLATNQVLGMFTEYGVPQDRAWQPVLKAFLKIMDTHPNVVGGTYWASGAWWGDYPLSVEPSKDGVVKPQFVQLLGFPTHAFPPSVPKVAKLGDIVGFNGNPTLFVVTKDGLYPFAVFDTYQNYRRQNPKAALRFISSSTGYTLRMQPIEDGGGQ